MSLVIAHDLSISFTTEPLFTGLSFRVEAGARIALTGANGSGKTTLARLISGQLTAGEGAVSLSREARIGYMEQQPRDLDWGLRQTVREVFSALMAIEEELSALNRRLEEQSSAELLSRQQYLQEQFARRGGYTYESRLNAALRGLGFLPEEMDLPLRSLSGGQRSKALLARALLKEANLLLLDEPTNHLDIEALEWLEAYLATWRGAFIIISHDRYFLDKLTGETWELAGGKLYQYKGNYSAALVQKEARENSLRHRQEQARREARRIEAIIEQQRGFNRERNFKTIASKQKQLARTEAKARELAPLAAEQNLSFSFVTPPPGGQEVLRLNGIAKGFGDRQLFSGADMAVNKGERVFLLGPNGSGKTTLLKIILGQLQPDSGYVKLGANIHPSYFDQTAGALDTHRDVLGELTERFPLLTQNQLRGMLGHFLFRGEDVYKPVAALSGGEKARLTLLALMLKPANLLLLDEPSNHLDLVSREAVEQALLEYGGAMLVVSHDRYLINKLAQRIYMLQADGLKAYLGNYDDYLAKQAQLSAMPQPRQSNKEAEATGEAVAGKGGTEYARRREEQSRLRKIRRRVESAEAAVMASEEKVYRLDADIVDAAADYLRLTELLSQREQAQAELEHCYAEWEEAHKALE
ncbi:MAG: ATP-binding cassette domain-containing protein [Clostridiales bacterium]|nr:ATP-binding cassette domain-containing protein [Clostridiales bacterium]